MSKSRVKILSSKLMYQGPVFGVRRDHVIEPNGVNATRDVVTHSGSVVVMPVFPNGDVLLIHQYRYAVRDYLWELVAGRKEPKESPLSAAKRELLEETGYRAKQFSQVALPLSHAGLRHRIYGDFRCGRAHIRQSDARRR